MNYKIINYISSIIKNQGPISIDKVIQISSNYYYSNISSIGAKYDFVTSPEISQLFGEIISIYLINNWQKNFNKPFSLIELGPGNGTMMSDILRTAKKFSKFYNNIKEVALIENSDHLKKAQKIALKDFGDLNISWYGAIDNLKGNNLFIIANEFLDALPIKQYCLKDNVVYEVVITLNQYDNLSYGLARSLSQPINKEFFKDSNFIEFSAQRNEYAHLISNKIIENGGLAVIVDYGYLNNPNKSTIQAVKNHKKVPVLENIGYADITSLVDFKAIQNQFTKNKVQTNILDQGKFLVDSGIIERANHLISLGANKENIYFQINKLISKEEMGELFKVLLINPIN